MNENNSACPNCGYCPHCGRSAQPYPVYPLYPVNPWPLTPWWIVQQPYGNNTGTITVSGGTLIGGNQ